MKINNLHAIKNWENGENIKTNEFLCKNILNLRRRRIHVYVFRFRDITEIWIL